MRQGRIEFLQDLAVQLKDAGIVSIAKAYMENTGVSPVDGRFKWELSNLNGEELALLEKTFHTVEKTNIKLSMQKIVDSYTKK